MKKLSIFFHDQTILNLPFLFRLMTRYYIISTSLVLLVISYTTYRFLVQKTFYSAEMIINLHSNETVSPLATMPLPFGGSSSKTLDDEIIMIPQSRSYRKAVAQRLIKLEDFNSIDLRTSENDDYQDLKGQCKENQQCLSTLVIDRLPNFLKIESTAKSPTGYYFVISTFDQQATKILADIGSQVLLARRREMLVKHSQEQIRVNQEVLSGHQEELREKNFNQMTEDLRQLKSELASIQSRFPQTFSLFQQKRLEFESITQLHTTVQEQESLKLDMQHIGEKDRLTKLQNSIEKLKGDINSLELSFRTPELMDSIIIKDLRKDLSNKLAEFNSMKSGGVVVGSSNQNIPSHRNTQLEYNVISEQFLRISAEYDQILNSAKETAYKISVLENAIQKLEPVNQLIKQMEKRILELTVSASTIVSDIGFADTEATYRSFKRITLIKYVLFTIFSTVFLTLLAVTLRYLLDRKIYDVYELENNFSNLPIIGTAPSFKNVA